MKCPKVWVFLLLVAWAGASSPATPAHAQSNPPFQNPSLDSNCYFPQIGAPGEIDTIYGSKSGEGLGSFIHNLGPMQGGMPGNMIIGNLGGDDEMVSTGPTLNLHNLRVISRSLGLGGSSLHFAHLRNSKSIDIFDDYSWIIYWADDNGNYDTALKTFLKTKILGNNGVGILGGSKFAAYVTHLTSDTVDDIVVGYATFNVSDPDDSLFLILFKGGTNLASKGTAYEDTSANFGYITWGSGLNNHDLHTCLQGDFCGTGRNDLIITDNYDLFFFPNDPPFSLQNLAHSIRYDTLCLTAAFLPTTTAIVMPFFPKKSGDRSVDVAFSLADSSTGKNNIYLFRGGANFGSRRMTRDSAAYVITPPQLGFQNWPGGFVDAGDMTGTGNHVLYTGGGAGGSAHYFDQNFYVTGQALDNKIDIFYGNADAGDGDTLTANADSLEDVILGNGAYTSPDDISNGLRDIGTIWLMYGSKNIPVHLNPQFSDVKSIPQENGAGISLSPNPTQLWSVATILWPEAEEADLSVFNLLGIAVQSEKIRLLGGAEQQRIYFPNLTSGVYQVVIHGAYGEARAKLVIIR